jgi:uncharacterized membrane protein
MPYLPNWAIALLIGGAIGLIVGYFVARKSAKEQPIQGGPLAKLFHFLAASAFVSIAPTVLVGAMLYHLPFFPRLIRGIGLGFGLLAVAAIFMLLYAVFEAPAQGGQTQAEVRSKPAH